LVIFQGITRITDNRHHATDVLGGAILGTFVAVVAVRKSQFFQLLIFYVCFYLVPLYGGFIQTISFSRSW